MWEAFAQSSKPEAHVKNVRLTKDTKPDKMWILHRQICKNLPVKYIVMLGKFFKKLYFGKKKTKNLSTCIKIVLNGLIKIIN